jgi:hypothetical protein
MKLLEQRRLQEEIFAQAKQCMMNEIQCRIPSNFTIPPSSSIPIPQPRSSSSSKRHPHSIPNPNFESKDELYSEIENRVNLLASKLT